jgi:hypothetical protein
VAGLGATYVAPRGSDASVSFQSLPSTALTFMRITKTTHVVRASMYVALDVAIRWILNATLSLVKPVSKVVPRYLFTNNPSQLFQINPLHAYRWSNGGPAWARRPRCGPGTSCRPADCAGLAR